MTTAGDRIQRVDVFPVKIPITETFRFATGSPGSVGEFSRHVFVRVWDAEGCWGWGEAHPMRGWSGETPESVTTTLERYVAPALVGNDANDRRGIHKLLDATIGSLAAGQPIVRCAIDVALFDLVGRKRNLPVRALLGGSSEPANLPLSFTVTAEVPEAAERTVVAQRERGFEHFNFKIGVYKEYDLQVARTLREAAGPASFLWADANQSLVLAESRHFIKQLELAGVDLLEQPLRLDDAAAMPLVRHLTSIAMTVDEASVSPAQYFFHASRGHVDYLCLKLTRSGGITPSMQQAGVALAAGQGIVVSGLVDSLLTRLATANVAAALGVRMPLALNGGQFLDESALFPDLAAYEKAGRIYLSDAPGVGVEPDEDALEKGRFAVE